MQKIIFFVIFCRKLKVFYIVFYLLYNNRMKIKKINLKNYRNYEKQEIILNDFKNIIIGKNAQGKTNILESICILSSLKSPRTLNNNELIKFGKNYTEIEANIEKNDIETELIYRYTDEKKRELRVNSLKTTSKNFKGIIKTVLFSTNDLLLLRGSPQDRRDWLDRAISQIYPIYDEKLNKYEKIKTQKNNLLKEEIINDTLLDVYNEQMAITGSNIMFLRKKFLKETEKISKEKHNIISEGEFLKINYISTVEMSENIEQISENFKNKLEENKNQEKLRRQSFIGPHRDDISFLINDLEAVKYASQGQQRTIVLSLKLSEIDILKEKTGEIPILLLDDVLAELDDKRQNYLLKSIEKDIQTVITSVDTLLFDEEFLKDVKIFKVEKGKIL